MLQLGRELQVLTYQEMPAVPPETRRQHLESDSDCCWQNEITLLCRLNSFDRDLGTGVRSSTIEAFIWFPLALQLDSKVVAIPKTRVGCHAKRPKASQRLASMNSIQWQKTSRRTHPIVLTGILESRASCATVRSFSRRATQAPSFLLVSFIVVPSAFCFTNQPPSPIKKSTKRSA